MTLIEPVIVRETSGKLYQRELVLRKSILTHPSQPTAATPLSFQAEHCCLPRLLLRLGPVQPGPVGLESVHAAVAATVANTDARAVWLVDAGGLVAVGD